MGRASAVARAWLVLLASLGLAVARRDFSCEVRSEVHFLLLQCYRLCAVYDNANHVLRELQVDGRVETGARVRGGVRVAR